MYASFSQNIDRLFFNEGALLKLEFEELYNALFDNADLYTCLLYTSIKSMGIKMVLSGEGADEVFGGYLYFHKAPDARAFHEETVRQISKLQL